MKNVDLTQLLIKKIKWKFTTSYFNYIYGLIQKSFPYETF